MCTTFAIVIQKGFQPKQSLFREVMRERQSWAVKSDQSLRSLNTGSGVGPSWKPAQLFLEHLVYGGGENEEYKDEYFEGGLSAIVRVYTC